MSTFGLASVQDASYLHGVEDVPLLREARMVAFMPMIRSAGQMRTENCLQVRKRDGKDNEGGHD